MNPRRGLPLRGYCCYLKPSSHFASSFSNPPILAKGRPESVTTRATTLSPSLGASTITSTPSAERPAPTASILPSFSFKLCILPHVFVTKTPLTIKIRATINKTIPNPICLIPPFLHMLRLGLTLNSNRCNFGLLSVKPPLLKGMG